MQESYLNSPIMYSVALTLIHFIWQGGLVALALKIALFVVPRQNSQLRYSFSALAMMLNLIIPIITFFIIYKPTYLQLTHSLANAPISGINLTSLASTKNEWYSTTFEYLPYITVLWLLVIGILSIKLIAELYSVNLLPKRGTVAPQQDLLKRFTGLVEQIGLSKTPKLLLSLSTEVPMAIGWLKPVVLIPMSMLSGLTPAQLDMLMLHELAHIRRHDYLVNFIQTLVEIILFFHPAVLWVSNQMRNEREYCSDDIAVHHCGNPIAYAHTLADTASICNKNRKHSIPSMAMAASGGDLTQRVIRLVNEPHCSSQNNVSKWFASLCVLSIVLFISSKQLLKLTEVDINTNQFAFNEKKNAGYNNKDNQTRIISEQTLPNKIKLVSTSLIKNEVSSMDIINTQSSISEHEIESMIIPVVSAQSEVKKQILQQDISNITETENNSPSLNEQINNDVDLITPITTNLTTTKELLSEKSNKKSIVELAFDKTDSALQTSSNNNKYVNEIAALSSDLQVMNNIQNVEPLEEQIPQRTLTSTVQKSIVPIKTNAKLVFSTDPKYPSTAKRKGIELEVKVDFIIDKNGRVSEIKFHPKNKVNYFRSSVRSAIEKWQFEPAQFNGQAIKSKMSKIFSFSLER